MAYHDPPQKYSWLAAIPPLVRSPRKTHIWTHTHSDSSVQWVKLMNIFSPHRCKHTSVCRCQFTRHKELGANTRIPLASAFSALLSLRCECAGDRGSAVKVATGVWMVVQTDDPHHSAPVNVEGKSEIGTPHSSSGQSGSGSSELCRAAAVNISRSLPQILFQGTAKV